MRFLDRLARPGIFRNARGWAWANLIAQIGIILTGGLVRLTGSGLGCSTWPMCEPGQFTPVFHEAATYHAFVEFGNRTMTVVLSVIAAGLILAIRRDPALADIRGLSWWPLIGIFAQALIGGVTVLLHLHPAVVSAHMFVSLALVAISMLIVRRIDGPIGGWAVDARVRAITIVIAVLGATLSVAGTIATGSGPHSGDDEIAYRLAADPVLISKIHAWIVWAFVAALIALFIAERRPSRAARKTRLRLIVLTLLQGALGYVQYFTGLPIWLVVTHMVIAAVFAALVTDLVIARRARPDTTAAGTPRERILHA